MKFEIKLKIKGYRISFSNKRKITGASISVICPMSITENIITYKEATEVYVTANFRNFEKIILL